MSVATLAVSINLPIPHSSAVPLRSSFPLPPKALKQRSPTTFSRALAKGMELSETFRDRTSCMFQTASCESESKQRASGVVAPVPRRSNARISKSGPRTEAIMSPMVCMKSVPDPPDPGPRITVPIIQNIRA